MCYSLVRRIPPTPTRFRLLSCSSVIRQVTPCGEREKLQTIGNRDARPRKFVPRRLLLHRLIGGL